MPTAARHRGKRENLLPVRASSLPPKTPPPGGLHCGQCKNTQFGQSSHGRPLRPDIVATLADGGEDRQPAGHKDANWQCQVTIDSVNQLAARLNSALGIGHKW